MYDKPIHSRFFPAQSDGGKALPVLAALILAMIFLQKLALNIGGGSIGIDVLLTWAALGYLFLRGEAILVPLRVVLLLVTMSAMLVATMLSLPGSRLTALGLLLIVYIPFIVQIRLKRDDMMRLLSVYQDAMVVVGVIVLLQQLTQYTIGNQVWPNLDAMIPEKLKYPGYAYIRPYSWNSPWLTPNAIFFLEPSVVSAFLATAAAAEIILFQRLPRLMFYGIAMVAGIAATGPAMLVFASPFLYWRAPRKIRRLMLLGFLLVAAVIVFGLGLPASGRLGEIGRSNSSAYFRVIQPMLDIAQSMMRPDILWHGMGAGASPQLGDLVQWPFSKLLVEYGLLSAIAFHVFVLTAIYDRPPDRVLSTVLVLPWLFLGGGAVAHVTAMPLMFFGTLLGARQLPADPRPVLAAAE